MVQFASYLRRVLSKTRLSFPRINGPNVTFYGRSGTHVDEFSFPFYNLDASFNNSTPGTCAYLKQNERGETETR